MNKTNFRLLKIISIFLISFCQESLSAQCLPTDVDSDNDGICDALDVCPNSVYNVDVNNDGSCLPADIVINEILTANYGSITNLYDEDGDSPDFIELFNTTNSAIDLGNWMLMDEGEKWIFPSGVSIAANGYLTIWASGKDKSTSQLHTNFKLSSEGEYLGLYDDQKNLVFEFGAKYPTQYNRLSYGINGNGQFNYFDTPTLNNANGAGYLGRVASPTANLGRGFYDTSIVETLTCSDTNATIRYTIDGTPVTSTSSIYTSSITIDPDSSGVVTLRAKAFRSGYSSSDEISFSYVFPSYMFNGNYYEGISDLPVISIQTDDQTFPECEGYDLEMVCDKEPMIVDWIEKDSLGNNKEGFSAYAGVNVFGETTTAWYKRNFRIHFDATYNEKYLKYPIFETYPSGENEPAEKFRKIELRGNYYEGINYGETGISEQWINSLRIELGELAPHSVYINVFVNGVYKGIYSLRERFDHNFYESYTDVDSKDINALKADYREPWNYIVANGSTNTWETMMDDALNNGENTYQTYKNILNPSSVLSQVAIESMVDEYGEKEFRIVGSDTDPDAPYRVISSDISDFIFNWEWNVGVPGAYDGDALLPFFYNWLDDPEFEQELLEFAAKHFCGAGALTVDRSKARMNEWKSILAPVADAELAFGYEDRDYTYTATTIANRIASWEEEVDYDLNLLNDLADMRTAWETAGLFQGCDLRPVVLDTEHQISEINLPTSYVVEAFDPDGDAMTFSAVSGLPPGLNVNSTTGEISGIPTQLGTYDVKLKIEDSNNKWRYQYFTWNVINLNAQSGGQLVINEIHYNPLDSILPNGGRIDDDNFEFIELKNIGTADVVLQGKVFTKGIDLEIEDPLTVEPNGFVVFAKDSCWFFEKYGFFPDAVYKDKLDNGGEFLKLKSPYKEVLDSLTYDDQFGWDTIPDGSRYSLALIDGDLDNALASSWSAQAVFTTPREENIFPCVGACGFVINDLHVMIQGPANQMNGDWNMNAALAQFGLLPQTDPYANLVQFQHINNNFEPELTNDEILSSNITLPIVDWVFIELRSANDPANVISTRSALLRSDGRVVNIEGQNIIDFGTDIPIENYHVAVRHRNHLGVMTSNPIDFSADNVTLDFTDPNLETWGQNAQVYLDANTRAMWAGNANMDHQIIYQGAGADNNEAFFAILSATENTQQNINFILTNYTPSDCQLDSKVIFQGAENDNNLRFFNILSHPQNPLVNLNFIIEEQLP